MGVGILLSQLEDQNEKYEKRLWTIERQVAFLNKMYDKMYAEMEKRDADSNAASEQAPPLSFKELGKKKGFICRAPSGEELPAIRLCDVEEWLKSRGLDSLIGE